jgi:hypothetical protein
MERVEQRVDLIGGVPLPACASGTTNKGSERTARRSGFIA